MEEDRTRSTDADQRARMTSDIHKGLQSRWRHQAHTVEQRIDAAIVAINEELRVNDGAYPHGSGRISLAEICRRAGVAPRTLQSSQIGRSARMRASLFIARVRNHSAHG